MKKSQKVKKNDCRENSVQRKDQLNELIRENMRLNEMIENMETKYSTFISEREGIMQVEVGMYKDELMGSRN